MTSNYCLNHVALTGRLDWTVTLDMAASRLSLLNLRSIFLGANLVETSSRWDRESSTRIGKPSVLSGCPLLA